MDCLAAALAKDQGGMVCSVDADDILAVGARRLHPSKSVAQRSGMLAPGLQVRAGLRVAAPGRSRLGWKDQNRGHWLKDAPACPYTGAPNQPGDWLRAGSKGAIVLGPEGCAAGAVLLRKHHRGLLNHNGIDATCAALKAWPLEPSIPGWRDRD